MRSEQEWGAFILSPNPHFGATSPRNGVPDAKIPIFPPEFPIFPCFSPRFSGAAEVFQRNRWRIKECWIFPGFGVVYLGFFGVKSGFWGLGGGGVLSLFQPDFLGIWLEFPKIQSRAGGNRVNKKWECAGIENSRGLSRGKMGMNGEKNGNKWGKMRINGETSE